MRYQSAELKPGLIAVRVQSMMPRSLIAFLLVCYILLVDKFFPARVALNDICCCAVRGTRRFFPPMRGNHTCSWWRCTQRTCTCVPQTRHEKSSHPRWAGSSEPPILQSVLDQFGSHVFRHGVANNPFRAGSPVTACRAHESFPGVNIGDVTHQFPELEHQP